MCSNMNPHNNYCSFGRFSLQLCPCASWTSFFFLILFYFLWVTQHPQWIQQWFGKCWQKEDSLCASEMRFWPEKAGSSFLIFCLHSRVFPQSRSTFPVVPVGVTLKRKRVSLMELSLLLGAFFSLLSFNFTTLFETILISFPPFFTKAQLVQVQLFWCFEIKNK